MGSKKGWKAIVGLGMRSNKSATRFCLFGEPRTVSYGEGKAPVYLNVYDLTPVNGYVYWAGLGIFHSGVEGVFEVEPKQCPGFKFRRSIFVGTTSLDPNQVREFMEQHAANYHGDTYHLIVKNCNHFCKDVCYKLTGRPIPKWVNRLAQIGKAKKRQCNHLLQEE
ncbi:DeSI-like protein At4g17486 [Linum perenne]